MATFLIGQPGPHFKPAASAGTDGARSRIRARLIHLVTLTGAVVTNISRPRAVRRTRAGTTVCGSVTATGGESPTVSEGDSLRGAMTS